MEAGDGLAIADIAMHIVSSLPGSMCLNATGKALRSQATMNLPLVEIGSLLSKERRLCQHRQNVLAAKRYVTDLHPGSAIRIGSRERILAHSEHDQRRVDISLEAEVAMHVFAKFASTADETRCCVKGDARMWPGPPLTGKPFCIVGEKTLPSARHQIALFNCLDAIGNVEPEKLAEIRPNQISLRLATKNRRRVGLLSAA